MNLKSLLIGSAAALVAAPAFAADVIIAEPEPVEYVEVCDVAGAGYFYIPGSRTCLQISGLVRHQLDFEQGAVNVVNAAGVVVSRDNRFQDGWSSLVRGEVNFRTFTETELGDLTSFIRFRANDRNQDPLSVVVARDNNENITNVNAVTLNGSAFLNNAVIGLGGLSLGMSDSLYDGGIAGEFDSYGGSRVHFVRYTADLGAFSASVAAELERENESQNDFIPNVVGQITGDIGAFSVDARAYYADEDDFDGNDFARFATNQVSDEFGGKLILGADFGPAALQIGGTYNSGDTNGDYDNNYEYSVGASATFGLGEKASLTFGGQYFANLLVGTRSDDDFDRFSIGANVDYEIVDGFDVKVAVNYTDDVIEGTQLVNGVVVDRVDTDGQFDGFIRFDRSF